MTAAWFPAGAGIRVDTHIQAGTDVPPFYDSLLAKLIAHGTDRAQALSRLRAAVSRCVIEGVATNLALHADLLGRAEFAAGGVDTAWFTGLLQAAGRG